MHKKLLFIGLIISFLLNSNNLSAETSVLIPLKKPTLTNQELANKLSKNILKPIKKPKKNNDIKIEEKNITEVKKIKSYHLKFQKKNHLYLEPQHLEI